MTITQPWPPIDVPPLCAWKTGTDLWGPGRGPMPDGAIYVLLRRGEVVYIGQSGQLLERLNTHKKEGTKGHDDFRWIECSDYSERLRLEALLILLARPVHNRSIQLGLSPDRVWDTTKRAFPPRAARAARGRPKATRGKRRTAKDVARWDVGLTEGAE